MPTGSATSNTSTPPAARSAASTSACHDVDARLVHIDSGLRPRSSRVAQRPPPGRRRRALVPSGAPHVNRTTSDSACCGCARDHPFGPSRLVRSVQNRSRRRWNGSAGRRGSGSHGIPNPRDGEQWRTVNGHPRLLTGPSRADSPRHRDTGRRPDPGMVRCHPSHRWGLPDAEHEEPTNGS